MKKTILALLSVLFCSGVWAETKDYQNQEQFFENQLNTSTDPVVMAKASVELAKIKLEQTHKEYEKIPSSLGQDRSVVSSSVREYWSYRQVASSFEKDPGENNFSTTYWMSQLLLWCCCFFAVIGLANRLRYRY